MTDKATTPPLTGAELDFSTSVEFKAWWDDNYVKLRHHSIYSKGAAVWNAAQARAQQAIAAPDFAEWLAREIPAGTVIGDPAWWAPRILRAALASSPASQPVAPEVAHAQQEATQAGYKLVPIKITPEMIEAAMVAHYGKRRVEAVGGAGGVDMTVNDTNYSGVQAMRRFWAGALSAAPPAPMCHAPADALASGLREILASATANKNAYIVETARSCLDLLAAPEAAHAQQDAALAEPVKYEYRLASSSGGIGPWCEVTKGRYEYFKANPETDDADVFYEVRALFDRPAAAVAPSDAKGKADAAYVGRNFHGWEYCPECGSLETEDPQEGCGYFCANCGQEWHGDIDYSEVVRKNLERLISAQSPATSAADAKDAERIAKIAKDASRYIEIQAAFLSRDSEVKDAMLNALTSYEWWEDVDRAVDAAIAVQQGQSSAKGGDAVGGENA